MRTTKQKKLYTLSDLQDVFNRGLYYGENVCCYKHDEKLELSSQALYDYINSDTHTPDGIKDIVQLPLHMFIMLYLELTDKK